MQADGGLLKQNRRNYKGTFEAYNRIILEEGGNKALFKGSMINVLQAVALNICLTGPYD
jgi:hypothetical protein